MNQELYDNTYEVDQVVLDQLQGALQKYNDPNLDGHKRATGILNDPKMTYQQLKRVKNYFENMPEGHTDAEFQLNGGDVMYNYANRVLNSERIKTDLSKKTS